MRTTNPRSRALVLIGAVAALVASVEAQVVTSQQGPAAQLRVTVPLPPWVSRAPMPTPRNALAGDAVNGRIYAIGGKDNGTGMFFDLVEVYDAQANSWSTAAPMPTARRKLTTSVVDGRIYAIGGVDGSGGETDVAEVYDPASDTWTTKTPMPSERRLAAEGVVGGKIYVIGGLVGGQGGQQGGTTLDTVEEYDPVSDTWSTKTSMPTARWGPAAALVGGKIYVIGGSSTAGPGVGTVVEVYDPTTDTWTTASPPPASRALATASAVGGKVYVIGGNAVNRVDEYDPLTDTWTQKSDMPTGRALLLSAVVNGKIYAIGGAVGNDDKDEVEVYDPLLDPPCLPMTSGNGGRPAFATTFGLGCSGANGVPRISTGSQPFLGNSMFSVELTGARPQSVALLFLSFGATSSVRAPSSVLVDRHSLVPGFPRALTTDGAGQSAVSFPIPESLRLDQLELFAQWAVEDPEGCFPVGRALALSKGLLIHLGPQR